MAELTRPHPTMVDVSRLAGVSLKTTSRVLNGEPHVAERTAARVRDAAEELGFRPNMIARELRQGARSTSVGLIIGDVGNPFYARVARGVERRLRQAGLRLVTASSDEDPDLERQLTADMLGRRVCGLLVITCLDDHTHLADERRLGIPVAFLDRPPSGIAADTIALDNEGGARLATRHLLDQGHRRIGLIGDLGRLSTHRERVAGFEAEMLAAGLTDWRRYARADSHDAEAAGRSVAELMALSEPPTALFATNNRITVGTLRALRDHPNPPALVGFDDFELADLLGVTVISHSPEDMGALGVERILARSANRVDGGVGGADGAGPRDAPAQAQRLPVRLIERGSGERPPG